MQAGSPEDFQDSRRSISVSVTTISAAVNLGGLTLVAIQMSAAWTAAGITLQASYDGTTFYDVYDKSGNEYTISTDAARYVILTPSDLAGLRHIKVRSGTTAVGVAQASARTLQLIARLV